MEQKSLTDVQKRARLEAELERARLFLQKEINRSVIKPISFEVYKKTPAEKAKLKEMRSKHNARLQLYFGKNWKKYQNVPFSS